MRGVRQLLIAAVALLCLHGAPPAAAEYGLKDLSLTFTDEGGNPVLAAGSHPFEMTTTFGVETEIFFEGSEEREVTTGQTKDLIVQLPPGFAGDPFAVPQCSGPDFATIDKTRSQPACSSDSAIGVVGVQAEFGSVPAGKFTPGSYTYAPVYNLVPPPGVAAEFGFLVLNVPVTVDIVVSQTRPYYLEARLKNASQFVFLYGSKLTLWGDPANPLHDPIRGQCLDAVNSSGELVSLGSCPFGGEEDKPFITLPRSCQGPLQALFSADSWEEPENVVSDTATSPALEDCDELGFDPGIAVDTTSTAAESPSGLDFEIEVDDPNLTDPDERAGSDIERVLTTLPEGVTTNPSVASGLSACSKAQYEESEKLAFDPAAGCPQSSKIGSVEITTPLLQETLRGSIYVARQRENEFGSLLALYMVIRNERLGILIKQAIEITPDPSTGRLSARVEEIPQLPFSRFHLHFREGPRAPLITPQECGSYEVAADLYPYANPTQPVRRTATIEVSSGPGGSACAAPSNERGFSAGTLDPRAGSYSPFVLEISRPDGSQHLSSISTTLPEGMLGRLAGIPYCSEAQIARAAARSGDGLGALELADPSCPAASGVGGVTVASGAGPSPLHVDGRAYLGGPYKGAPLSLLIVTPAIAGPFDLGVVVVRTALQVDETTAQITAVSDPIPTILHGLPLDVRSVAIQMDRPNFTLNPTSCEPKSISAQVTSTLGQTASLSQYYQARDCGALGFKPKLSLRMKGGVKRTAHPALKTTLTYPSGAYANIARAVVTLPAAHIIDNAHIGNPCTRVQFREGACPPKSVLGTATATSPLLDEPLSGPVYFRSNGGEHPLPDIVADLHGQIHVVLVGNVDSMRVNREVSRIRTTFARVPDAPVSKFTLSLFGGKRGLLVNKANVCKVPRRAIVTFVAQNNKRLEATPKVANKGCKGKKRRR